ncbi:MAG: hypothetical protein EXS35_17715 [Pedosphaera sp.]|nr:hypothetical protein [Pedosphaera sp.]
MQMKRYCSVGLAAVVFVAATGCNKSEPAKPAASTDAGASKGAGLSRWHWLGKNRLAADTNAIQFLTLWNLPESVALETQTLDKLSLAPWRLLKGDTSTNVPPAKLLRPLLDDLVREESFVELRAATNHSGELALAIRLNRERAALWETNLAVAMESLTGASVVRTAGKYGWSLKSPEPPRLIELTQAGEWTLLGLTRETNSLLSGSLARIQREGAPFPARSTNYWFEGEFDLAAMSDALALGGVLPADAPRISLTAIGDGKQILTRGEVKFPKPLPFEMESWNIPTNLIREPLVSFTAVRGVAPWLSSGSAWPAAKVGPPPNQVYFWALDGFPLETYFAAPFTDASNRMARLTELLTHEGNTRLASNSMGRIEHTEKPDGVVWKDAPFMSPFIQAVQLPGGGFVSGGFVANTLTNHLPPTPLFQELRQRTNLVAYDWELTGPRVTAWVYLSQLLRLVNFKAQLAQKSAGLDWLQGAGSKLGNSVTAVTRTGPDQLSVVRKSDCGFTSVELHLLADWLESPEFPRGMHTFLAPTPAPFSRNPPKTPRPSVPPPH